MSWEVTVAMNEYGPFETFKEAGKCMVKEINRIFDEDGSLAPRF